MRARVGRVIVSVLGAALLVTGCGAAQSKIEVSSSPVPPASPLKSVGAPAPHYKAVDFGMLRLWVPHWYAVGLVCDRNIGTVFNGPTDNSNNDGCPLVASNTVTMGAYNGIAGPGTDRIIHGYRVVETQPGFYEVPALMATIRMHGRIPAAVLDSVGPSPFGQIVAPGPREAVPSGWRMVAYKGVEVDVPPSWPTASSSHINVCDGPFLSTPVAFVGPAPLDTVSCPDFRYNEYPARAGVWLEPGNQLDAPSRSFTTPDGQQLQLATGAEETAPLVFLTYHGETVTLGIGTSTATTRAVLDSIRYDASATNSHAEGTCPTWRQSAMPAPERSTSTRTFGGLLNTQTELRPVAAGIEPRVSADAAWRTGIRYNLRAGVTYQIVLGEEVPDWRVAGGERSIKAHHGIKLVPSSPVTLVWAIYGAGTKTPFGDCGGYSVAIVDATTGKQLVMVGGE